MKTPLCKSSISRHCAHLALANWSGTRELPAGFGSSNPEARRQPSTVDGPRPPIPTGATCPSFIATRTLCPNWLSLSWKKWIGPFFQGWPRSVWRRWHWRGLGPEERKKAKVRKNGKEWIEKIAHSATLQHLIIYLLQILGCDCMCTVYPKGPKASLKLSCLCFTTRQLYPRRMVTKTGFILEAIIKMHKKITNKKASRKN